MPPIEQKSDISLPDLLPDFLIVVDMQGVVLEWNQQATKALGYTRQETVGQIVTDITFNRSISRQRFKQLQDLLARQEYWEGEIPFDLKNGRQEWFIIRARRVTVPDGRTALLLLNNQLQDYELRDKKIQTAIDSSQKELSDILLAVGDVVCAYDIDENVVTFISPSCEQLTGHTDIEFMDNDSLFMEIILPEDVHLIESAFSAVKAGEVTKVEYRIRRPDSRISWVRNSMTPNTTYDTETTRVTCVMTDTTAYHELNELKSRMIQMASHDLNNPLSIAIGFFSLMVEDLADVIPDHLMFYVNSINEAHEHMSRMLAELLDLEQLESRDHLDLEAGDLVALITEVINEYSGQLHRYQHQLHFDAPREPIEVLMAEVQLRHAFGNLLGNAIKYTPENGHVVINIIQDSESVIVEVADNGVGVPESFRDKLFEPFKRARQQGTEHIKGTGLGLSLVKSIIDQHHGEIFYRPGNDSGSVFGFWLPLPAETENQSD